MKTTATASLRDMADIFDTDNVDKIVPVRFHHRVEGVIVAVINDATKPGSLIITVETLRGPQQLGLDPMPWHCNDTLRGYAESLMDNMVTILVLSRQNGLDLADVFLTDVASNMQMAAGDSTCMQMAA